MEEGSQNYLTDTKYFVRSSVLGNQVLTETDGDSSHRTFVYAGQAVLAWQQHFYSLDYVDWERRDPSGASVRFGGVQQELDPFGGDAGVSASGAFSDPGPLLTYGGSFSSGGNVSYTVDGIRVSLDDFIRRLGHVANDPFALLEASTTASSRPAGSRRWGVREGRQFDIIYDANGHIESQWWGGYDELAHLAGDRTFSADVYGPSAWRELAGLNPQNTAPNESAIREGLKNALSKVDCSAIVNNLLNSVATKKNPRVTQVSPLAMFDRVVNGSGGLTRVAPPGSAGYGSPTGSLKKGNAGIFLEARQFGPVDQLSADTMGALGELMHLGGQNAFYTDRDFAEIVHRDFYNFTTSIWPGDPADTYHKAAMKDPNNISWSYYWHQAVDRLCFGPGGE